MHPPSVAVLLACVLTAAAARADDPRAELPSPVGTLASAPAADTAPPARARIRAWQITLTGLGYGEVFSPHGAGSVFALGLALYGRLTPWASLGARIVVSGFGYSDLGGFSIQGGASLPSIRFSFREELDGALAIEAGLHLEAGFFGGTRMASSTHDLFGRGAFGAGGGVDVALDLGPSNAIVLELLLEGWGSRGSYAAWAFASLGYLVRFD